MQIIEYMNRLAKTEEGEYLGGLEEKISDAFYELDQPEDSLGLFIGSDLWGKRNLKEEAIYTEWSNYVGDMSLDLTPFRDAGFLRTFLTDVSREEQFKYVYNTTLYTYGRQEYDPNYVILTRRSLPSTTDKPEQFWTSVYIEVMNGLTTEIPKGSPHRLHSVILATTLNSLEKYGYAFNHGGRTDGEVMINYAPFRREDILFVHKSDNEISNLATFLNNGGTHLSEVLQQQKQIAEERQKHYNGFEGGTFDNVGKSI